MRRWPPKTPQMTGVDERMNKMIAKRLKKSEACFLKQNFPNCLDVPKLDDPQETDNL